MIAGSLPWGIEVAFVTAALLISLASSNGREDFRVLIRFDFSRHRRVVWGRI